MGAKGRGRNSNTKNAERCRTRPAPGGWAAIRTPCSRDIGLHELGGGIRGHDAGLPCPHLSSSLPRKVQAFHSTAIRWARLRGHCLNIRMTHHGGVVVHHAGHRVRSVIAVLLSLRLGAAFAHEGTQPRGTQNPGNQNAQKKYRSRCSQSHLGNSTSSQAQHANLNETLLLLNPFPLQNHLLIDIEFICLK